MSEKERWLVAVCAGRWQIPGILAAQAAGLKVLAIDGDAAAPGLALADRARVVNVLNTEAVISAVRDSGITPAGAVAFVAEAGMRAVAGVRDAFNLPGPRQDLIIRLTDKSAQRAVWSTAGLPCPSWFRFSSLGEAESAIARLGQTVIFKPIDSAGSRGVTVVRPGENWRKAAGIALAGSRQQAGIVEDFIVGVEYTVETVSIAGRSRVLAVTEKRKVPGSRGTVAMELSTPNLSAADIGAIGELAVQALAALGYEDGPGHTEILRDGNGLLWLVETAGRGGGFMVADGIVPTASGYDLAQACALLAVGCRPMEPPDGPSQAIVLRFLPSQRGRVISLTGFEQANALPGVECAPMVTIGQMVEDATSDGDRMAYILTHADDRTTALALADQAEATIKIGLTPE